MAWIFALVQFDSWVASQTASLVIVEFKTIRRVTIQKTSPFPESHTLWPLSVAPVRFSVQFSLY